MDMNGKNDLMEKFVAAVTDMDDFLSKGASTATIAMEARETAEELLKNFQEELQRREEANIALQKEITELKKRVGEATDLRETISLMDEQLEKMRRDNEQAIRERDAAKGESVRLQALWNKVTSR